MPLNADDFAQLIRAESADDPALAALDAPPSQQASMVQAGALRDASRIEDAGLALKACTRLDEDHVEFWVELLIIQLVSSADPIAAKHTLARVPEGLRRDHRLVLLAAVAATQNGELAEATRLFVASSETGVEPGFFMELFSQWRSTLEDRLAAALSQLQGNTNAPRAPEPLNSRVFAMIEMLSTLTNFADFHSALSREAFIRHNLTTPEWRSVIPRLPPGFGPEHRVACFAMLCSLRDRQGANAALKEIDFSEPRGRAAAVKWLIRAAEIFNDPTLTSKAHSAALTYRANACEPPADDLYPAAKAQHLEVLAHTFTSEGEGEAAFRSHGAFPPTSTRTGPRRGVRPHFFVGLFGQWRFPEVIIPRLCATIRGCLENTQIDGLTISFGVATWDRGGSRIVLPGEDFNILYDRIPGALANFIVGLGVESVDDFSRLMPSTHSLLVQPTPHDAGRSHVIDAGLVNNLVGRDCHVDIGSDPQFMVDIGTEIQTAFPGSVVHLNQGRMWNRMAALTSLSEEAEIAADQRIDGFMFCRPDLSFHGLQLAPHIAHCLDLSETDSAWVDLDPYADFLEGLGDRFVLGTRRVLDRLGQGQMLMKETLSQPPRSSPHYWSRLSGHQLLGSLLFEQGTHVHEVSRSDVPFEIDRGRLSLENLKSALLRDAERLSLEKREILLNMLEVKQPQ